MDEWREIYPYGSNVWLIAREMYNSACVCISNKSGTHQYIRVVVDGCYCVTQVKTVHSAVADKIRTLYNAPSNEFLGHSSSAQEFDILVPPSKTNIALVITSNTDNTIDISVTAALHTMINTEIDPSVYYSETNKDTELEIQSQQVHKFLNRKRNITS